MALTKITANVAVHSALDDNPSDNFGNTAAFKAYWDSGCVALKSHINDTLIPEIEAYNALGLTVGGAYNPATAYTEKTLVTNSGSTYLTLRDVTGVTPTNDGTNYLLIAQKGETSNRNLLHNWDFRNPVNQRGASSYTGYGYTMDRWLYSADSVLGGIAINAAGYVAITGTLGYIEQIPENYLPYGTYTASIQYSDGTIFSGTVTLSPSLELVLFSDAAHNTSIHILNQTSTSGFKLFRITQMGAAAVNVVAAKLELGSVSTLANGPPADYGEQLALCKRFYRLWTTEAARTAALNEVGLMRLASPSTGTITIGGVTYYYASADL